MARRERRMTSKPGLDQLLRESIERGRAAERVKGLAALSLVIREDSPNLVAFLWLAPCVRRSETHAQRSSGSASRR